MCGFAGVLGGSQRINKEALKLMTDRVIHRGPDSSGQWFDEKDNIFLGHRRLSILDVSSRGSQPMSSQNGRYILAFNGEIYNHLEIRKSLEKNINIKWTGSSDTETLVMSFQILGIQNTIRAARGMFAMSVWDRKKKCLSLIRDRIGEKPLYYGWQNKDRNSSFLFGSELKSLKTHPSFLGKISRKAVLDYLKNKSVTGEDSIYENIYKVSPGFIITIDSNSKNIDKYQYWSMEETIKRAKESEFIDTEDNISKLLESTINDAVKEQMISDVPIGAFLSGGIDSSTIVALMQKNTSSPVKTFAIGFEDKDFDEAIYAKDVANYLGTDHTELYVSSDDALKVIPKLSNIYDEPFSDSSQIPTFLVSELASKHVKVSLSGDSGDELFCGYNRYTDTEKFWNRISFLPKNLRRSLYKVVNNNELHLIKKINSFLGSKVSEDKIQKGINLLPSNSKLEFYRRFITHHWYESNQIVLNTDINLEDKKKYFDLPGANFQEMMMIHDLMYYLVDDILTKVDRASMSVSLESRIPFLDPRVVEIAWKIPIDLKINRNRSGLNQKAILRKILYRHVPKKLIDRPKKGFGIPISSWLRGPLLDWAESLINENRLKREGIFDYKIIRKKWSEHLDGSRNWHSELWGVLMFQEWLDKEQNS